MAGQPMSELEMIEGAAVKIAREATDSMVTDLALLVASLASIVRLKEGPSE